MKNSKMIRSLLPFITVVVLYIIFRILQPERFGNFNSMYILVQQTFIHSILACGFYYILSMDIYDLTVGINAIISSMVGVMLSDAIGMPGLFIGAILTGILISFISSFLINDNIAATCMEKIGGRGFVTKKKRYKFAEESAGILNVKMYSAEQIVGTLSGGNKQKVVLAKWIARGTEIFIMDSPTRGIDVGVKAIIYNMLDNLRKEGKSLIIISEELLELIGMCDRVIILKDGEISGEFKRSPELDEETLVQCMV